MFVYIDYKTAVNFTADGCTLLKNHRIAATTIIEVRNRIIEVETAYIITSSQSALILWFMAL